MPNVCSRRYIACNYTLHNRHTCRHNQRLDVPASTVQFFKNRRLRTAKVRSHLVRIDKIVYLRLVSNLGKPLQLGLRLTPKRPAQFKTTCKWSGNPISCPTPWSHFEESSNNRSKNCCVLLCGGRWPQLVLSMSIVNCYGFYC